MPLAPYPIRAIHSNAGLLLVDNLHLMLSERDQRWTRRSMYGLTALFYIAFAGMVAQMMVGSDTGGNTDQLAREWTAWALSKPFGRWIVGATGFGIAAGSIALGVAGGRFDDEHRRPLVPSAWLDLLGGSGSWRDPSYLP